MKARRDWQSISTSAGAQVLAAGFIMALEKPDKEVRFSILRLWGSTTEEKQRGNNLRTGWPRAL